jgi:hypothetical protein
MNKSESEAMLQAMIDPRHEAGRYARDQEALKHDEGCKPLELGTCKVEGHHWLLHGLMYCSRSILGSYSVDVTAPSEL